MCAQPLFRLVMLAILALAYSTASFAQESPLAVADLVTSLTEQTEGGPEDDTAGIQVKSLLWLSVLHAQYPPDAFRKLAETQQRRRYLRKTHELDPAVRQSILELVRINPNPNMSEFLALIHSRFEKDDDAVYTTLLLLGDDEFLGGDLTPLFKEELIEILAHKEGNIWFKASDLLSKISSGEEYVRILIDLLQSERRDSRGYALIGLKKFRIHIPAHPATLRKAEMKLMREALPAFVNMLEDEDPYTRGTAVSMVGWLNGQSPEYADEIAQVLFDPHHIPRLPALAALSKIRNLPEVCGPPLLHCLLKDKIVFHYRRSPTYSEVAAIAISNLGKNAEPILPELKRARRFSPNLAVRYRAKRSLKLLKLRLEEDELAFSAEALPATSP